MHAQMLKTKAMSKDQRENAEKEIIQIYLYLISRTNYDPMVIEIMKLSALSNVKRRYKLGEPWSIVDDF
jgi:hypothetical protein